MPRLRTPAPAPTDTPVRRRPNPVLVTGLVSLTLTLSLGWWFVLRAPERSADALCAHLGQVAELDERLAANPEAIDDEVAHLRAAVAVAPDDVAPDVLVLAEAVTILAEEAGARPEDRLGGLRAGMTLLEPSTDDLEAASTRVVAWAEDHCGLRLGDETAAPDGVSASHPDGR